MNGAELIRQLVCHDIRRGIDVVVTGSKKKVRHDELELYHIKGISQIEGYGGPGVLRMEIERRVVSREDVL